MNGDGVIGKINDHFKALSVCVIVLIMIIAACFCCKKQGYYIDEYYLYTLANGTQLGVAITPGQWNETSGYLSQLVSEGNENFAFKQMYEATSNNVHPFLYYALVHLASSFVPGVFSKWIGLSINLCLFLAVLILAREIAWKLSGKNSIITIFSVLLFGLSPATISMVVLVRMYLLLALWTLLLTYVHLSDLEREKLSVLRFLLPVFICGFCGFLTQYFFVIVLFFFTFVYGFYLVVYCHRLKDALIYAFTSLASLVCTYFIWPVSFFHIFKGYRGKGAASQFTEISKFGSRLWTNTRFLNKMVFGGLLPLFIAILILGIIVFIVKCIHYRIDGKRSIVSILSLPQKSYLLIGIVALLTYLVLTQVALQDGIYCMRQFYMVYALLMLLVPTGVFSLGCLVTKGRVFLTTVLVSVLIVLIVILGCLQKSVLFLYENDAVIKEFAKTHPKAIPVMFQADDGNYDSRLQDFLMYPRFYFASTNDLRTAEDSTIAESDELLVYIPNYTGDRNEMFDSLVKQNRRLKSFELLTECDFFEVYYVH